MKAMSLLPVVSANKCGFDLTQGIQLEQSGLGIRMGEWDKILTAYWSD